MNAVHDAIQDEAAAPAIGRKSKAAIRAQHEPASEQDPTVRRERVAMAAYYLAERRSFEPGRELDDWLAAEYEVEKQLRQSA